MGSKSSDSEDDNDSDNDNYVSSTSATNGNFVCYDDNVMSTDCTGVNLWTTATGILC